MYRIELINKKTKQVINYDDVVDLNDGEKMFFKFQINTKQLDDGEYTLNLYDDDTLIKTDTLNVGDFNAKALQYKRGEDIYVETKIDVELTNKFVELTDINSTIYPDDGIDGMLSVTVDAQQVYDNGIEKGYEDGKQNGIEEQKSKLSSITIEVNGKYTNEDGYNEVIVNVLPKLQEKQVTVSETNTTVTPDTEFQGLSQVNIDAIPLYNSAYSEGKSDGVEEQKEKLTSITINRNGTYNKEDGYDEVTVDVKMQSYSYLTNTVDEDGLKQLGWSDDDINYFKDNNLHYEWQNKDYIVSQGNKNIVINSVSDIVQYKDNPDFEFCPFFDVSSTNKNDLFKDSKYLKGIPLINLSNVNSMFNMFSECKNLVTIPPIMTSKATNMNNMFLGCKNLATISQLETSNVTSMSSMFGGCTSLSSIPQLNTSKVTDMRYMFSGCASLSSIPQLETSKVTNMSNMFSECKILATIPPIITSNVNDMSYMFNSCNNLTNIPLLDTSKVYDMRYMFQNCTSLSSIPQLNTSKVTDMRYMFKGCASLSSIPQLETSKVDKMGNMFEGCASLQSIGLLDFTSATGLSTVCGYSDLTNLTDLGGFKDLKQSWSDNYGLAKMPNLTKQSVLNVINNLYNFRENGNSTTTRTIKFHKNSLALLSDDEKAIATAKGWVLTS